MIGAALETHFLDFGCAHVGKPAAALGQPAERIVMMHHGLAVGADLQVAFDAVAAGNGGGESAGGILDHAGGGIMQAAMGQRSRGEPF